MATENYNYLYGLTVQGIQQYIFATNKLEEIIGASDIIEHLCITWFQEFLNYNNLSGKCFLNAAGNIRFQGDEKTIQKIFSDYHFKLLKKAPGVPFSQAVVKICADKPLTEAFNKLDNTLRGQRNISQSNISLGNMARSKYKRTGDFTSNQKHPYERKKNIDLSTSNKLKHKSGEQLIRKLQLDKEQYTFPTEFKHLTTGGKDSWLAVLHIDGNGMGNYVKSLLSSNNTEQLTEFSKNINKATLSAFNTAITETFINADEHIRDSYYTFTTDTDNNKITVLPFRPLVLGGDDVSLIMRADFAINFTETYLKLFEENTKTAGINNGNGLTACAGIAFVKEKFPFHYSTNLAEELCKYAKEQSNRKHSCLQFHKVQDSIFESYKAIITKELKAPKISFDAGPYYLHKTANVPQINHLKKVVAKFKKEDAPKNKIRAWVDASFNTPVMASELKERIPEFDAYIPEEKETLNILTLLAIQ